MKFSKVNPRWKLNVHVDDIYIHVRVKNEEVLQAVPMAVSELKNVTRDAKLTLSLRE